MNRPTKAQLRVLQRIAAGENLKRLGGPNAGFFFHSGERGVDYRTVFILLDREWIRAFKPTPHSLDPHYELTYAGRQVVKAFK